MTIEWIKKQIEEYHGDPYEFSIQKTAEEIHKRVTLEAREQCAKEAEYLIDILQGR